MRPAAASWSLAVALALVLTGCGDGPRAPREGVSVQQLTGDVSGTVDLDTALVGDRISLAGTVVRVLSPRAFELSAADGASDRPVLVLGQHDDLDVGQQVQVAGSVRLLLDDETAARYGLGTTAQVPVHDGKRVVEAETVDDDVPGDGR
jgi:hypothetical protein